MRWLALALLLTIGALVRPSPAGAVLLNVPLYKQCDAAWSGDPLGTCSSTMCSEGCAVTSSSMVYTYFGGTRNPGQLNTCLTNNGGYASGCLIYWTNACMPAGLTYDGPGTSADIDAELAAGHPVITWVSNGSTSMHFVVIVGNENGQYQINDPYWDYDTISAGGYTIQETRLYHGTTVSTCDQTLTASGPMTIDDQDPCFLRHGSYWWDEASGFDGHHYYTYAIDEATHDCWAQWRFDVADGGTYEVSVYLPGLPSSSVQGRYVVVHGASSDEVILDQTSGTGWASLGQFSFAAGPDQYVALNDNTGEPLSGHVPVRFDAIRVTPVTQVTPDAGVDVDAASVGDGGPPTDAGGEADAGGEGDAGSSAADASTIPDAGPRGNVSGGCSCRSAEAAGDPGGGAGALLLALFVWGFVIRRRAG